MPSTSWLCVATASAMDMPHSVHLPLGHQPMLRAWFMGPASANITLVASTVSSVRISIMICHGIQLRMGTVMPARSASAMGMPTAATSTWPYTWHLAM